MNTAEVCRQLGVTQKLLRTFEDKHILSPMRLDNNYRDYNVDDLLKIKCILILKTFGFSYLQIKKILDSEAYSESSFHRAFYIQSRVLSDQINQLKSFQALLQEHINHFLQGSHTSLDALSAIIQLGENMHYLKEHSEIFLNNWDFDVWATHYDENVISKNPEQINALNMLKNSLQTVPPHTRILDLGCGSCWIWQSMQELQLEVTGVDISLVMLSQAQSKYPWIHFHLGDLLDFTLLSDQLFDITFSCFTMHHIHPSSQTTALSNMLRLTTSCGKCIIVDRMYYDDEDKASLKAYYLEKEEYQKVIDIEKEYYIPVKQLLTFITSLNYTYSYQPLDRGVGIIEIHK